MLLVLIDTCLDTCKDTAGDGVPGPGTDDLLAVAYGTGLPVHAVTVGTVPAGLGVERVHVIRHDLLGDHAPEALGESLAQLVARTRPSALLAAATERGDEVLAQTAARAGLPLATRCVALTPGEPWSLTRVRGGGMLLEDAELTAPVVLATVAPGAASGQRPPPVVGDPDVVEFIPELDPGLARTRVVERVPSSGGVSLATAPIVVSGGRGVGSAEGYAALDELAQLLGGAVGCSRVATNNGWRPHSDQVGLTGTQIAPDLYIACGISGATQHWVGCMNARTILAINTDPEAPMVTRSTYAVLGDLHEVLPAVIDALRARSAGASKPPASELPASELPASELLASESPATESPASESLVSEPSGPQQPAGAQPPGSQPPKTQPAGAQPLESRPTEAGPETEAHPVRPMPAGTTRGVR
ncbi:electron transfer flavoprotein subunit alpha/FixB family protein [Pseudonocardia parietis]|uniref:Electron transfer flavoprotein alpha subunit n=1 Tax=Pseudonocardia parietis TaxID=570936 RepID=A0ABS4VXS5_9PSEU|nr:electron transfer flavoprotein subunit alpha/FixB family protein [Pseudonocardia parietis]MBP2368744.1 electron transfer flavoprotein alpha subunit [Pseudonocardia parietis]